MRDVNGQLEALPVNTSLAAMEDRDTARLTIVNAVPCPEGQTSCPIEVADLTDSDEPFVLVESVEYSQASPVEVVNEDEYMLGAFPVGAVKAAQDAREDEDSPLNLEPVVQVEQKEIQDNTHVLWVVAADTTATVVRPRILFFAADNNPSFGGATGVGQLLFTRYMLPFQIIAVLLLVAMIGVIVLTKQYEAPRPMRAPRRMANVAGNPTVDDYVRSLRQKPTEGSGD
jgi:hypothetical protein